MDVAKPWSLQALELSSLGAFELLSPRDLEP